MMLNIVKKLLPIFLSLTVLLTLTPSALVLAANPVFPDMPNNWSANAIQAAVDNGLLTGINGKLMPDVKLTRAQMAAIINRAFGAQIQSSLAGYTDISAGKWYLSEMAKAVHMKTFAGSNGKLDPEDPITREQASVVLARALNMTSTNYSELNKFSDAAQISSWARGEIAALAAAGYISGSNAKLNPKSTITRAEFAQFMDNIFKTYIKTTFPVTSVPKGNVLINVPGANLSNLTVSGDLIVGDGVGDGEVILDNVKVTGRLVVRGGGAHSIRITGNSDIGQVIVSKVDGNVSVKVLDGSAVNTIYVNDGKDDVIVEGKVGEISVQAAVPLVLNNTTVDSVKVDVPSAEVTVSPSSTVSNLQVSNAAAGAAVIVAGTVAAVTTEAPNTAISVSGTVGTVTATTSAENTKIAADSTAKVTTVATSAAKTNIAISGTVGTVTTNGSATGTEITTTSTAKVQTVNAAASNTQISGAGTITQANVTANDVKINTVGTSVTVASGITGTTANGSSVQSGQTTTATSTGSTGSTGSTDSTGNIPSSISVSGIIMLDAMHIKVTMPQIPNASFAISGNSYSAGVTPGTYGNPDSGAYIVTLSAPLTPYYTYSLTVSASGYSNYTSTVNYPSILTAIDASSNLTTLKIKYNKPLAYMTGSTLRPVPGGYDFKGKTTPDLRGWYDVNVNGTDSTDDSKIGSAIYSTADNSITITLTGDAAVQTNNVTVYSIQTTYAADGSIIYEPTSLSDPILPADIPAYRDTGSTTWATSAKALADKLNAATPGCADYVPGLNIAYLKADCTIHNGQSVIIPNNTMLRLSGQPGQTVYHTLTVQNGGTFIYAGTLSGLGSGSVLAESGSSYSGFDNDGVYRYNVGPIGSDAYLQPQAGGKVRFFMDPRNSYKMTCEIIGNVDWKHDMNWGGSTIIVDDGATLTFNSGVALDLDEWSNISVSTNGAIINNGTINLDGTLVSSGEVTNNGTVNVADTCLFTNDGVFTSQGTITNNGTITNGTSADSNATFDSYGTITNNGTLSNNTNIMANYSILENTENGTINCNSALRNYGGSSFINNGVIVGEANVTTYYDATYTDHDVLMVDADTNALFSVTEAGDGDNAGRVSIGHRSGGAVTYVIAGSVTLNQDLALAADDILEVGINSIPTTFTVDGAITNQGAITNNAIVINNGTVTNGINANSSGTIDNYGTLTNNNILTNNSNILANYGILVNSDSATINCDSALRIYDGSSFTNNGTIKGNANVSTYYGATYTDKGSVIAGGNTSGSAALFTPAGDGENRISIGYRRTGETSYVIIGNVTLNTDLLLGPNDTLTVGAGGLPASITVNGTLSICGTVDANFDVNVGSVLSVIIGSGGGIEADSNFFNTSQSLVSSPISSGTYIWDVNAGGPDIAGWLQQ